MENAALALQAFVLLGLPWQAPALVAALQQTRVAGRLDRRRLSWQGRTLNLLLDVGHNPHAAQYLAWRLAERPLRGQRLAVFGLLGDKDLPGVVEPLLGVVAQWAVAPLPTPRSRSAEELQAALQARGARASTCSSVAAALDALAAQATADDEILVFGSFYSVAEALHWLEQHGQPDPGL